MYKFIGDKVYVGHEEHQWVGFYSPIISVELMPTLDDLKVTTELGEYILCNYENPEYVATISGKSIYDLQREHYPHLYNEDGTWKRD